MGGDGGIAGELSAGCTGEGATPEPGARPFPCWPRTLGYGPGDDLPTSHLIRTLGSVVSTHAADELEDDHLSLLDLENIILPGQIAERQRDRATREAKVVVQGFTLAGDADEVVVKVSHSGKLVIITVYVS